jgi:hypothetical protein
MAGRFASLLLVAGVALAASSCTNPVDLKQAVEVTETSSGWFDAGIVDGKNKLVPSVTFRLRKKPDADLKSVSLNVVFRKVPLPGTNVEEDFQDVFLQNVPFSEGNQTALLVVRAENGYTGEPPQGRLEMLQNSQFRDARGRVFAKHSGSQWIELAAVDIQRQLLTR